MTRPFSFGDDTIVRYTSSMIPVRTDGVPIAESLFGKVDTAGAYVPRLLPPLLSARSTETDVFCAGPRRARADELHRVAADDRGLAPRSRTSCFAPNDPADASATAMQITPMWTMNPP